MRGVRCVVLRDRTDPIPIWVAGEEFEPDPAATAPAAAVQWRRSSHRFWNPAPLVRSKYDWRGVKRSLTGAGGSKLAQLVRGRRNLR